MLIPLSLSYNAELTVTFVVLQLTNYTRLEGFSILLKCINTGQALFLKSETS